MNTSLRREDILPLPNLPTRRDKGKGGIVKNRGGGAAESVLCRAARGGSWKEKKFSSYPFGENAVPKLVARFVTESSRETRSPRKLPVGDGLYPNYWLSISSPPCCFTCHVLHHHLRT